MALMLYFATLALSLNSALADSCAAVPKYTTTLELTCDGDDIYYYWPNYANFSTYYGCQSPRNPVLLNCAPNTYFNYVLQTCYPCDDFILCPACESLRTQHPPICVPIDNGNSTTPVDNGNSTTPLPTNTTQYTTTTAVTTPIPTTTTTCGTTTTTCGTTTTTTTQAPNTTTTTTTPSTTTTTTTTTPSTTTTTEVTPPTEFPQPPTPPTSVPDFPTPPTAAPLRI
ncbi:uncharacterized protein LOC142219887 [Haematobia irritans]|uniref:uncharacterized protein LOC142219887 n=1 Tax=Haematobia irritans TaxID=7368 RepID=UPI003F50A1AD